MAAKRYAEAADLIAREDGTGEAWAAGLRAMAALFGDADAVAFLENSRVPAEQKQDLVRKAMEGAPPEALNMALLLLRRRRFGLAPQIAEAFQELLDAEKGISHATVTSAVPLTDDERAAVRRRLTEITGGEVEIETEVDEDILGGLIVRIGDRLIDGSTRNRLQELKQQLAGARS
ncbi:MAG TPA: F0F1 ATP synthase subunit delta [Dehalococcoidia bacterium]|nr:F0F1 ATP synthase subunit delta [Dehalococcoidia bacterium]